MTMVVDRDRVEDRIDRIRRYTRDLRDFGNISREAFRSNRERQYAVLHAMQNAIEACIEIASHIVSADRLGAPRDYASLFTMLEQHQILPTTQADCMRQMARFRNRIVHLYWDVDLDLVYEYLTQRLADFDDYLAHIDVYLGPRA
jgi:uncharacterized protein YutE (UPF0331/DUF86 family)